MAMIIAAMNSAQAAQHESHSRTDRGINLNLISARYTHKRIYTEAMKTASGGDEEEDDEEGEEQQKSEMISHELCEQCRAHSTCKWSRVKKQPTIMRTWLPGHSDHQHTNIVQ